MEGDKLNNKQKKNIDSLAKTMEIFDVMVVNRMLGAEKNTYTGKKIMNLGTKITLPNADRRKISKTKNESN